MRTLTVALLALTVLGNFFNAFTAALLVAATLAFDLWSLRAAKDADARAEARRALAAHFVTPLVALALCLFWLAPVATTYAYSLAGGPATGGVRAS